MSGDVDDEVAIFLEAKEVVSLFGDEGETLREVGDRVDSIRRVLDLGLLLLLEHGY